MWLLDKNKKSKESVSQFEIGRKRKEDKSLNPKRSKFLAVKNNCGTAPMIFKIWKSIGFISFSLYFTCPLVDDIEFLK